MPRPTAAQLAYGSATVVISTVAMLLLSRTTTGIGVAVIGVAALALGLLVAVTVPAPAKAGTTARAARTVQVNRTAALADHALPGDTPAGSSARLPVAHAGAEPRVGQHSLRR
ncbi:MULTISPECIES: hypothetical protein [Streptomyces]|uniref:Uncharacterized protein n=1 Tax=Streptomyces pratisoli TaxID=3139917 RepID=A0ACC6QGN2_9ACTN|nr:MULTISPECIES: hypothetical protein [unclassified Streptomyces]MCX4508799.1 hypothetical protein [Streptomyces sp. NBC_01619]